MGTGLAGTDILSTKSPRGDSRPRLSGGAKLRYFSSLKTLVELRSTGQPGAAVPTWALATQAPDCDGNDCAIYDDRS